MEAFRYLPIDWDLDLTGRDWRIEASLGVNRRQPFAGVRLARYETGGPERTRRFQIWEESLIVIPSTPRTAIIAIGNVLTGAINSLHEENERHIAEMASRLKAKHRRG